MELPPPSPSQAPTFTQPILETEDFVRWGKDLRPTSSGNMFGTSSGYSSVHVSRTSSSDSSLFPEDLTSEPEDSHSAVKPGRHRTRRLRSRLSDSASQNGQSFESLLPGHDKPGEPSQPKLVEMLKDVSEVLEENTRLKKKRLEREVRKSRLKTRPAARPYNVSSGARASSTSTKTFRKVPEALGKEVAKPLEPMSVDPAPRRSRQNTVSKGKGKEVSKISVEDSMDVDCSVTIDVSMSEDPLPKRVVTKSESPPSQSQSSAKMMPPPPVPPKALKQSPKPKPPPKSTPSKTSYQPPPSSPSLTQSNPLRRRTLGMTRTTTQTSAVSHSVLPPNRKPFKSPLVKQEPGSSQSGGPSRSQSKTYPVPTSSISSQPIYPTQKPAPAKPAPKPKKSDPSEVIDITDDPDTSYDFSTSSIDGEEVDRVMAEYDRA